MQAELAVAGSVKAYCARIGADALLVQGAGGNASWKTPDTLWVKASGTWLADALTKEIFVPVDLRHLRQAIEAQRFDEVPQVQGASTLRPSIETMLHALLPHKVVLHAHAVELLVHLVQADAKAVLQQVLGDRVRWVYIDYFKPGADLATAVFQQIKHVPDVEVVFLKNHGAVIGGDDVESVDRILRLLISALQTAVPVEITQPHGRRCAAVLSTLGYEACGDDSLNQLALAESLCRRLRTEWALVPDHVVFLGPMARVLEPSASLNEMRKVVNEGAPFIFVEGDGVYQKPDVTSAQLAQLRCYYDVLIRLSEHVRLCTLSAEEIADLLDWDAEKYRQKNA
ncbi:class II aldolase/adducin family protein [Herbaspirillum aquaticum]|jgi:rhamnose utilization protein RhaD (predicted bifunctional aldolase and dehydrogenase)|uniref:class II aldolase/adducin family protein n=1 Tax=Herbaspirillum aquaticum TaxID=568783 RepID=UPI0024DEF0CD|nr:class II aldolase/adducin family protein [Herbaspirillum aquaticum]